MKEHLRKIYHKLHLSVRILRYPFWAFLDVAYRLKLFSVFEIPVVINNFNRLTYLQELVAFLEKCRFATIIIFDNNSTYPPLLEFYKTCKHTVIRSGINYGHLAFWKSGLYSSYKWNYFIYTDSDVLPVEECPKDFIVHFKAVLKKNYSIDKVGFGIRIDDLPDYFALKEKVVKYEERYWQRKVKPGLYDAPIDNTFALYRPLSDLKHGEVYTLSAWRTGVPYVIRHLPWYTDSNNLPEEEAYYIKTCNSSSSIGLHQKGNEDIY